MRIFETSNLAREHQMAADPRVKQITFITSKSRNKTSLCINNTLYKIVIISIKDKLVNYLVIKLFYRKSNIVMKHKKVSLKEFKIEEFLFKYYIATTFKVFNIFCFYFFRKLSKVLS